MKNEEDSDAKAQRNRRGIEDKCQIVFVRIKDTLQNKIKHNLQTIIII